jgi:hypothetical protein
VFSLGVMRMYTEASSECPLVGGVVACPFDRFKNPVPHGPLLVLLRERLLHPLWPSWL